MIKRKTPMRMCVGCREMKAKTDLIRVVRTPEGNVVVDRRGKLSGRGAYICPTGECFKKAVKSRAIQRQLEVEIDETTMAALEIEVQRRENDV